MYQKIYPSLMRLLASITDAVASTPEGGSSDTETPPDGTDESD